jgi:hypothetical protein
MLMKKRTLFFSLFAMLLAANVGVTWAKKNTLDESATSTTTLDANEQTHLVFMREEEKLARDVYITLSTYYPDSPVFGRIDDSEQNHTDAVKAKLQQYNIQDPNTNDNVGVFTGADYGWYFTEKYEALITRGAISEFEALYVGAFIEELDMMDINQCPKVIVETHPDITDVSECGKVYTDNPDIQLLYANLLDGSESHLAAYVRKIEAVTGVGTYQAQVLPQDQVDRILGR